MAAKGKALVLVAAAIALLVTPAAVASIPRSTMLDPQPIDRFALDDRHDGQLEAASIDNARLLHRALARALPASAPVASLSETRVWASVVDVQLLRRPTSPLSRALHRASADLWPGITSDRTVLSPDPVGYADSSNLYSFCHGNPIGCRDPLGLSDTQQLSAGKAGQTASVAGVTFDSRGDYFEWLLANGVDRETAMKEASNSGLPDTPVRNLRLFGAAARGALMAEPAVTKMAIGLNVMSGFTGVGMVAQVSEAFLEEGATKTNLAMAGLIIGTHGLVNENAIRLSLEGADLANDARAAMRARVLANIAASRSARTASGFGEFASVDRELTPFRQYMRAAETLDVATAPNKAVFYSGPGNRALAEAFASTTGRTTLEMTPGGSWLDAQRLYKATSLTDAEADLVWARLSERYAAGASGEVNAFIRGARADRLFNTSELPILRSGRRVSKYIYRGWGF